MYSSPNFSYTGSFGGDSLNWSPLYIFLLFTHIYLSHVVVEKFFSMLFTGSVTLSTRARKYSYNVYSSYVSLNLIVDVTLQFIFYFCLYIYR